MQALPNNPLLPLPENTLENIRKIFNLEKPGRMSEAIDVVEIWLNKQDHILNKELYTKENIEIRIIACKGSTENAKKSLDRLATMKKLLPKFFEKTNLKEQLIEVTDIFSVIPLPTVTNEYHRVIIFRYSDKHIESEHFMMSYQLYVNLCVYILAKDYVNGYVLVYDFRKLNVVNVLAKLNLIELQKILKIVIEGYRARLKCIYFLTESKAIGGLVKTIKKFLSEKLGNKIQVVQTLEELYKTVPRNILPAEYGGNEKSVIEFKEEWFDALSSPEHQKYMETMNTVCTDESLRHSCKFNEEYLGMPGSFKSLVID